MLTLKEFNRMLIGYNRRLDRNWDIARTMMADARNLAFGSKGGYTPRKVMTIPSIDKRFVQKLKHISSFEEAEKLLKSF